MLQRSAPPASGRLVPQTVSQSTAANRNDDITSLLYRKVQ